MPDASPAELLAQAAQKLFRAAIHLRNRFLSGELKLNGFLRWVTQTENELDRLLEAALTNAATQKLQSRFSTHRDKLHASPNKLSRRFFGLGVPSPVLGPATLPSILAKLCAGTIPTLLQSRANCLAAQWLTTVNNAPPSTDACIDGIFVVSNGLNLCIVLFQERLTLTRVEFDNCSQQLSLFVGFDYLGTNKAKKREKAIFGQNCEKG